MKGKVYIYIFLAIIVVVIGAGVWMYFKPHRSVAAAEPAFILSASELIDAFVEDEAAATMRYGGKIVNVKGPVSEIILSDTSAVLQIGDGSQMAGIRCYLDNNQKADYSSLRQGDPVSVKGICNGMLLDVVLDKCILLSEE